jgi:hypothetical protein
LNASQLVTETESTGESGSNEGLVEWPHCWIANRDSDDHKKKSLNLFPNVCARGKNWVSQKTTLKFQIFPWKPSPHLEMDLVGQAPVTCHEFQWSTRLLKKACWDLPNCFERCSDDCNCTGSCRLVSGWVT